MRAARTMAVSALLLVLVACGGVTGTAQPARQTGIGLTVSPPTDSPPPITSPEATPPSSPESSGAGTDGPTSPVAPTAPVDPSGGPEPLTELDPVDVGIGRWLEGRRIANQMASPYTVDPAYTMTVQPTLPIRDDLGLVLDTSQIAALQQIGGLEAGFVSGRRTVADDSVLILMVLEFSAPEQAALAAAQVPTASSDHQPLTSGVEGAVLTRRDRTSSSSIEATLATGQLLQYVYLSTGPGVDGQPAAEKALQVLAGSMAGFQVSAPDARLALPDDRDSLVAHTLGGFTEGIAGWYTAQGALHYQYDYGRAASTFERAGVDLVVVGAMNVYRSSGAPAARLIQADFLSESASAAGYTDVALDGLPAATSCMNTGDAESVYCVGTVGRYAFEFSWEDPVEAVNLAQRQEKLLGQL